MKTKRLLGSLVLLMSAMLLGNTATAQITSVADLEGVYTMSWKGYYWDAYGEWLGHDGTTTIEVRAIEGTDSIEMKNFFMDGAIAKAYVDLTTMRVTIPKQRVSDTMLQYFFTSTANYKFDAISLGIEDWDYEMFVPSANPLTGTINTEKKFNILGPMTIFQFNNPYFNTRTFEKITLTYESPLPDVGPTEPVRGDLNNDGKVDVSDVNIIINIMLGKE